ncbi:CBS domain containing protein [Pirellula staleyi DSM 6068]|uniref:CBS domain containing protein n=1 Tax=Pirellula staleyi (strain ATCC 27377 / DSM 6068 / ICPB 4128) TaxID=530564 RepID=D2R3R7_PIRSD|nr:CBS domain-containing protein [Pirellula staleyi]ADB17021.1 CBS domain containing protein [Pirellula staleyi DSM 6068]
MILSDLITYNPISCREETTLAEVHEKLQQLGVRHLPVVSSERKLVGVISKIDVLRALESQVLVASSPLFSAADNADSERRAIAACQVMTARVLTCSTSEEVAIALARLVENQIHSLPVVDEGKLVGMITSSDFLRELACGGFPTSHDTCGQLLENAGESVETDASLEETLLAMHTSSSPYVVIVRGDFPVGVVSRRALVELHVSEQLAASTLELSPEREAITTLAQLARKSPTARPSQTQAEVAQLLIDHQLEALAVVNQAHRVLGIVTVDGLLQAILHSLARSRR